MKEVVKEYNLKLITKKYLNASKQKKIKELQKRVKEHIEDDKCFIVMFSRNKDGILQSNYFSGFSTNEMTNIFQRVLYESTEKCKLDWDKNIE